MCLSETQTHYTLYGEAALPEHTRSRAIAHLKEVRPGGSPAAFIPYGSHALGWFTPHSDYDGHLVYLPSPTDGLFVDAAKANDKTFELMPAHQSPPHRGVTNAPTERPASITPLDIRLLLHRVSKSSEMAHYLVGLAGTQRADWYNATLLPPSWWQRLYVYSELFLSPYGISNSLRGKIHSTTEDIRKGKKGVYSGTMLAMLMVFRLRHVRKVAQSWQQHTAYLKDAFLTGGWAKVYDAIQSKCQAYPDACMSTIPQSIEDALAMGLVSDDERRAWEQMHLARWSRKQEVYGYKNALNVAEVMSEKVSAEAQPPCCSEKGGALYAQPRYYFGADIRVRLEQSPVGQELISRIIHAWVQSGQHHAPEDT